MIGPRKDNTKTKSAVDSLRVREAHSSSITVCESANNVANGGRFSVGTEEEWKCPISRCCIV